MCRHECVSVTPLAGQVTRARSRKPGAVRRFLEHTGIATLLAGLLSGCGGGSGSDAEAGNPKAAPAGPATGSIVLDVPASVAGTSHIALHWRTTGNAATFSVWLQPSRTQEFREIASGVTGTSTQVPRGASWKLDFPTARIRVRGCDATGARCTDSNEQPLVDALMGGVLNLDPLATQVNGGYGGFQLSSDGNTLVATQNTQMGMYGEPYENFLHARVDVFHRDAAGRWHREAHLPTPDITGVTGSTALSGDGNTLAFNLLYSYGGYAPDGVPGAIVVYGRNAQHQWVQQARLQAPGAPGHADPYLGSPLALSADGRRLAAGGGLGIHVFDREDDGTWRHDATFGPSSRSPLAMSANGKRIATAVYQGQVMEGAYSTRYFFVRVYARDCKCGTWSRQADLYSDDHPAGESPRALDDFGQAGLMFDHAGATLAIGAPRRGNGSAPGAVYVFGSDHGTWQKRAILSNDAEGANDRFGRDLALSGNGRVLAGSACSRFATSAGIHRNYREGSLPLGSGECHSQGNSAYSHGAHVYRADRDGAWSHAAAVVPAPVPPRFPGDRSRVGERLVPLLSADGQTLVLGAFIDQSPFDGTQTSGLFVY